MTVHVIATLVSKPALVSRVEAALRELVAATRQEPGNQRYDLFTDAAQDGTFHLIEAYRDQAALETHRQTPHYLAYRSNAKDWLEQAATVHVMHELDVAERA